MGPTTVCLSLYTFLPSYLPTSCLTSCLHFRCLVSLTFYLLAYSPTFLSFCLPSIFSACLPLRLSVNSSVYCPQSPTFPSQPLCACSPSRVPQDLEMQWAVGSDVPWSGGTIKVIDSKNFFPYSFKYFTSNTFTYYIANIKTSSS